MDLKDSVYTIASNKCKEYNFTLTVRITEPNLYCQSYILDIARLKNNKLHVIEEVLDKQFKRFNHDVTPSIHPKSTIKVKVVFLHLPKWTTVEIRSYFSFIQPIENKLPYFSSDLDEDFDYMKLNLIVDWKLKSESAAAQDLKNKMEVVPWGKKVI